MKTKLILVEGKKVKCRPMKAGETLRSTDIAIDDDERGFYTISEGRRLDELDAPGYFRPLKSPPKKKREVKGVKPLKVWALLNSEGKLHLSYLYRERSDLDGTARESEAFAVLITPLPSGKKGKKK